MITATGIITVILIYVIPLSIPIYLLSTSIVNYFIELSIINPGTMEIFFYSGDITDFMVGFIYTSIIILIFIFVRFALYGLHRYMFITKDIDIYDKIDEFFTRYDKGLGTINLWGRLIVLTLIITMIYLKIYDIKILVFAVLTNLFIFKKYRIKKRNKDELKSKKKNQDDKTKAKESQPREGYKHLEWEYHCESISVKEPILFHVDFNTKDTTLVENTITGHSIERSIMDFARDVKAICEENQLSNKQRIEALLTFISSFKIEEGIEKKTPAQVILEGSGNNLSVGKCGAEILRGIDLDVVEFDIPYRNGETKVTFAVEGADLETEDNYFIRDDRKYYYCEIIKEHSYYMGPIKNNIDELV